MKNSSVFFRPKKYKNAKSVEHIFTLGFNPGQKDDPKK